MLAKSDYRMSPEELARAMVTTSNPPHEGPLREPMKLATSLLPLARSTWLSRI